MNDRLPSAVLVSALLRRVNDAGGIGTLLARGDAQAGAILIIACEKGRDYKVLERGIGNGGEPILVRSGPQDTDDPAEISQYWSRRRARDPDLWVIEVDIANAERFAAETIIAG